jgi:hypothetical protein
VPGLGGFPPTYTGISIVRVVDGRSITVGRDTTAGVVLVIANNAGTAWSGSTFQSTVFGPGLALGYTVDVLTTNSTGRKG